MPAEERSFRLLPELLYVEDRFRSGLAVEVDPVAGRIRSVGPAEDRTGDGIVVLPGRALLPGFVNGHSHAFQRAIRGRTQRRTGTSEADFWSWRTEMYRVAAELTPEDLETVSRFCYLEMLRAGFTAVGEFHYLHRDRAGRRYAEPDELACRILRAAADVGIRIVLLNSCYARGGIGERLRPEQRRFATPDLEEFLADTERLRARTADFPMADPGVGIHSIRAVPRDWLGPIGRFAAENGLPLHMHLCEQPAEVEACRAAFGRGPVEVAAEEGLLGPGFTGVHLTHPTGSEVKRFGEAASTACLCPTTERDLGDGIPPARELLEAGARFSIGTDSHARLDPFSEMRLIEYHERLRSLRRVVLTPVAGMDRGEAESETPLPLRVAPQLLRWGTEGGADALGLGAGRIRPGAFADMVAVNLDHPVLAGWTEDCLQEMLVFSANADVVTDVWVGGIQRVECGRHPLEEAGAESFRRVVGALEH